MILTSNPLEDVSGRDRFRVIPTILVILVIGTMALIWFRNDLMDIAFSLKVGDAKERVARYIGKPLDPRFEVRLDGQGDPVRLAGLLGPNSIVVKYSASCSVCRSAVDQYLARGLDLTKSVSPDLYVLSFEENAPFPPGVPIHRRLLATFPRDESWFAGGVYPSLWRFGQDAVLLDVMVGLDSSRLDLWMDGVGVAPVASGDGNQVKP